MKPKLLAYCDSPQCLSGFAQVSRNILKLLAKEDIFDIDVAAIAHDPSSSLNDEPLPYTIIPLNNLTPRDIAEKCDPQDPYGRQKLINVMIQGRYDAFWTVQDPFVLAYIPLAIQDMEDKRGIKKPISCCYFPVDASNPHKEWLEIPFQFDYTVTYTEFGKNEAAKKFPKSMVDSMHVIYHGTDTDVFRPLSQVEFDRDAVRKSWFGDQCTKDTFVVMNMNRNQCRKDLPRTMIAFKKFHEMCPDSILWMFCKVHDIGWWLDEVAKLIGLEIGKDVFFAPYPEEGGAGFSIQAIAEAYNMVDVVVTTTLGEGFGLSTTEAMACKVPVVAPNNSALTEIIGANEERGFLVPCGTTSSEWTIQPGLMKEPLRPFTNLDSLVLKMKHVYENRNTPIVGEKVEAAYRWIQPLTWENIFKTQWMHIFQEIYEKVSSTSGFSR